MATEKQYQAVSRAFAPKMAPEALAEWRVWKKLNAYEKARYYYKAGLEQGVEDSFSTLDLTNTAPEEV